MVDILKICYRISFHCYFAGHQGSQISFQHIGRSLASPSEIVDPLPLAMEVGLILKSQSFHALSENAISTFLIPPVLLLRDDHSPWRLNPQTTVGQKFPTHRTVVFGLSLRFFSNLSTQTWRILCVMSYFLSDKVRRTDTEEEL